MSLARLNDARQTLGVFALIAARHIALAQILIEAKRGG